MYIPNLNTFVERARNDLASSGMRPVDSIDLCCMSIDIGNRHGTFLDTGQK
jgi:hypothetical protein